MTPPASDHQPDPAAGSDRDAEDSSGLRPTRRPRPAGRPRSVLAALREAVVVIAAALALSLLVKTFLVQAFFIPSASMRDTLLEGDRILVSQLTPGPFNLHRGDVVVFADPGGWLQPTDAPERSGPSQALVNVLTFVGVLPQDSDQHLVKRVIGLGGDHVICCNAQGRTTVNGAAIEESPYLRPGSIPSQMPFDVVVPPGRVWVEGDNRQDSEDSRFHTGLHGGGSVPQDLVVGRALVTVWPLDHLGWLSDHDEVFASVPAAAGRQ